jgi:hypothetical protein
MSKAKDKDRSTVGYTLFDIPWNADGKAFVKTIRNFINRDRFTVRVRGNGARAAVARLENLHPRSYDQDLPLDKAETVRVYFEDKHHRKMTENRRAAKEQEGCYMRDVLRNLYDILGIDCDQSTSNTVALAEGLRSPLQALLSVGTVPFGTVDEDRYGDQGRGPDADDFTDDLISRISDLEQHEKELLRELDQEKERTIRYASNYHDARRDCAILRENLRQIPSREPVTFTIAGRTITVT